MKTLVAILVCLLFSLGHTPAQTGEAYLQQQLAAANQGNYWAKYNLWDSYYRGKNGVAKNLDEANKWLPQLVEGVSVVRFEPAQDFNPANPKEFLTKFNEYSRLRSAKDKIGAASFFRTTKKGGKLVASFLTDSPDKLKADIQKNPSLKFVSVEKMTPEAFLAYEKSKQESL
jgi:hypothetical protein